MVVVHAHHETADVPAGCAQASEQRMFRRFPLVEVEGLRIVDFGEADDLVLS